MNDIVEILRFYKEIGAEFIECTPGCNIDALLSKLRTNNPQTYREENLPGRATFPASNLTNRSAGDNVYDALPSRSVSQKAPQAPVNSQVPSISEKITKSIAAKDASPQPRGSIAERIANNSKLLLKIPDRGESENLPSKQVVMHGIPVEKEETGSKTIKVETLNDVARDIAKCMGCVLSRTRKNTVPGEGAETPEILFIGEGPGEFEDKMGRPFVGNAGQLLDKLIERMGYSRKTIFIANVVKCRPPGNRDPQREEAMACMPFLIRQISILKPKVIVCLGRVATNFLLGSNSPIKGKRGVQFDFRGIPVIPTYHPSYILHQQSKEAISKAKWEMWEDMQKVLALINSSKRG